MRSLEPIVCFGLKQDVIKESEWNVIQNQQHHAG